MQGSPGYAPNVNVATYTDLYLDANAPTLAQMAAGSVTTSASMVDGSAPPPVYGAGHPIVWAFVIVAGFLFLGWLAHFLGRGGEFSNTRVSAVSIIIAGASAVLFIYALKLVALWLKSARPNNGFSAFALGL